MPRARAQGTNQFKALEGVASDSCVGRFLFYEETFEPFG